MVTDLNESYDVIVIGAGHNGLVVAAYLAKAGHKVLVLEKRPVIGGAAATEEIFPGFQIDTGAHDAGLFQDRIVKDLALAEHGLVFQQNPVAVFAPQPDGSTLTLWDNIDKSVAEIAAYSQNDAASYTAFAQQVGRMARILRAMFWLTPPDLAQRRLNDFASWFKIGWQLKRLGDKEMMDFMRILPLAMSDYLDEWFENETLKGVLGADGITGSRQGPRSAGTTLMFLYQHARGLFHGRQVLGGIGQVSNALASAAQKHGAEIQTNTPVERIDVDDYRASGVTLSDGRSIAAKIILSSVDPRQTFFNLIGPTQLEPRFMRKVRHVLYRGSTAKINLALSGLPQFNGQTDQVQLGGHIRISPGLDYLERAYDAGKYGRISEHPYLDITIPTLADPGRAPAGYHIMSIVMQYAPYRLHDGEWAEQGEKLGDLVVETLAHYAPGIKQHISQRQIITPLDWERQYGLTEGSIFHGQMGLDQLLVMRPVPGWSQYRTPIDNLFLCGAGTHPGGGLTGIPGHNAAREVLRILK